MQQKQEKTVANLTFDSIAIKTTAERLADIGAKRPDIYHHMGSVEILRIAEGIYSHGFRTAIISW